MRPATEVRERHGCFPDPRRKIVVHVQRGEIGAQIAEVVSVERAEIIQTDAGAERTACGAALIVIVPRLDHLVRRAHPPRLEHRHEPLLHLGRIDAQHARLVIHRRALHAPPCGAQLHELAIRTPLAIVAVHTAPDSVDGREQPVPPLAIVYLREHTERGETIERFALELHALYGDRVARVDPTLESLVRRVALRERPSIIAAVGRRVRRGIARLRVVRVRREPAGERRTHRAESLPIFLAERARVNGGELRRERRAHDLVRAAQRRERSAIGIRRRTARTRYSHAILHQMKDVKRGLRARELLRRMRGHGRDFGRVMARADRDERWKSEAENSAMHSRSRKGWRRGRAANMPARHALRHRSSGRAQRHFLL